MSGHSKWATIHRQKETTDQKRGAAFTKISNAIIVAIRDSGGIIDPESNFKLRLAIEKGRSINMPKENVQRAIDRGSGKSDSGEISEITYEGYGPGGVGILVETATDNKQRTVQEIKNIFDKNGGTIASPGAVSFNFKKVGFILLPVGQDKDEEILKIIDLGAEDVEESSEGFLEVYSGPDQLMALRKKIVEIGYIPQTVELIMKPINLVNVNDPKTVHQILGLMEKLESSDDVQKVYANFEIPDNLIQQEGEKTGSK